MGWWPAGGKVDDRQPAVTESHAPGRLHPGPASSGPRWAIASAMLAAMRSADSRRTGSVVMKPAIPHMLLISWWSRTERITMACCAYNSDSNKRVPLLEDDLLAVGRLRQCLAGYPASPATGLVDHVVLERLQPVLLVAACHAQVRACHRACIRRRSRGNRRHAHAPEQQQLVLPACRPPAGCPGRSG